MIERINKIIDYLKTTRKILSQAEFADKLGVNPSQISEMLSGKRPISERTINKITRSFPSICNEWLLTGKGEMLKNDVTAAINATNIVSMPAEVWEVIRNQAESLKTKDAQTTEVIAMLKDLLKKRQTAEESFLAANVTVVENE